IFDHTLFLKKLPMIDAILTLIGKASAVAVRFDFPNTVLPDTIVIKTADTEQFFTATKSGGRHIKAVGDSCMFTFISRDAKKTVGITIAGFSSINAPCKLVLKERKDGTILYCPDNRTEPVVMYSSL